jgi:hypothetical protein
MFKTILAFAWILLGLAAVLLGLNGSISWTAMVTVSLVALALFYAFALWTVISNTRDSQLPSLKIDEYKRR